MKATVLSNWLVVSEHVKSQFRAKLLSANQLCCTNVILNSFITSPMLGDRPVQPARVKILVLRTLMWLCSWS